MHGTSMVYMHGTSMQFVDISAALYEGAIWELAVMIMACMMIACTDGKSPFSVSFITNLSRYGGNSIYFSISKHCNVNNVSNN